MDCNNLEEVVSKMDITCRICSETFERGFHILGEEGKKRNLHAKIRRYLYITVSVTDRLPKIICISCYCKIESFHSFVLMANKNQVKFTFSSKEADIVSSKQKNVSLLESYLTRGSKESDLDKESLEELEVEVDPMWFLECVGGSSAETEDESSNNGGNSESKNQKNWDLGRLTSVMLENSEDDFYDREDSESELSNKPIKKQIKSEDTLTENGIAVLTKINKEFANHAKPLIGATNFASSPSNNEMLAEIENNNTCEFMRRAYNCDLCFRRFSSEIALHNHIWTHSRLSRYTSNPKESENNDENLPLPGHSIFTDVENNEEAANNENSCPICGKVVSTRGNLKVHLETHRPKGKYGCESCGRIFKTQCNLQRHQRYHDGVKYSCEVCGRVYSTNSTLRAHAVTHSELRPHECPLCEKKFKRNQDLKFHINQHTGAKPYRCPYCPKAFASSGNCFSHRKRMHPVEVERDREKAAKFM